MNNAPGIYKFPSSQILIFAKAPVENKVKTRLLPAIDSKMALALYRAMLENIVATTVNSQLCCVSLYCTPDSAHPNFEELASKYSVTLENQQGENLGDRMLYASAKSLNTCDSIVIVGTDCLQLTESFLEQVLAGLTANTCDAIITPAHDGGYVLLGLNRTDPGIFEGIDWGTDRVMDQTRSALRRLGWNWQETPTLRDVDTFDDIQHVYKNEHQYSLNTGVRDVVYSIFKELSGDHE